MTVSPVNVQNAQNNKQSKRSAAAIAAGAAIGAAPSAYVFYDTIKKYSPEEMKSLGKTIQLMMPDVDTFENIQNIAQKALKDTGLAQKGVTINTVTPQNVDAVAQEIKSFASKQPFINRISQKFAQMFGYGGNAAYVTSNKKIYIGESGAFSSVFHEMGHAMNGNFSKSMKILQKLRDVAPYCVPMLGLALFAAGLLHRVKPESLDNPKSKWEKTKDFVKNNSGKLTFLTFLSILIEEGVASKKGIALAKNYLKPEQVAQLAKNYKRAFGTYAIVAALTSAGIGLGNIIADAIQNKKNEKQTMV